jgi:hypothetical protein
MEKKKAIELAVLMRQLVSDVQGAPYPGEEFEPELYKIWYEHLQRNAQKCFEFLNDFFPLEQKEFEDTLKKLLK